MRLTKEEKLFLKKRIEKKIEEIETYLEDLYSFVPENIEEYKGDVVKRMACERCCEKIAEALVDLAIFLIRFKEIGYNDEDEKAFGVLLKNNIIDEKLCGKLRNLKVMRYYIAHRYGEINDEIVFNSVKNDLEKDVEDFLAMSKKIANECII